MAETNLRLWALKGAEQRLVEITEEAKAIFASFPELRAQGRGFMSAGTAGLSKGRKRRNESNIPRRGKRTMSAEARKRIGDAQRARWAKQKAANGTEEAKSSPASQPVAKRSRKKR